MQHPKEHTHSDSGVEKERAKTDANYLSRKKENTARADR
jgi:hypothetical protein